MGGISICMQHLRVKLHMISSHILLLSVDDHVSFIIRSVVRKAYATRLYSEPRLDRE